MRNINQFMRTRLKRSSTIFLQVVIVLIGIGALSLMLWEPHLEGRNANATLFQIYFNDPFLAYAYTGSIAFFVALCVLPVLLRLPETAPHARPRPTPR